jgi:hypothetical protein
MIISGKWIWGCLINNDYIFIDKYYYFDEKYNIYDVEVYLKVLHKILFKSIIWRCKHYLVNSFIYLEESLCECWLCYKCIQLFLFELLIYFEILKNILKNNLMKTIYLKI